MAESFGTDPARYDRARPGYPEDLVRSIVTASPGREVLDVGCGTGIVARQFRAAGCTVLGVEPDVRMAEFAERDGLRVEVATFEDWEPAGRTFDAVVAGQTWHWVDPRAGAAKAARVLRPGGSLALFWHVFDPPAEIAEAAARAYRRVVPDAPFDQRAGANTEGYLALLGTLADGLRETGSFAEPEQRRYDWTRDYTRDEWLDLLPTQGSLTRLTAEQTGRILDEVGAAIDALGGGFTMRYTTVALIAATEPASFPWPPAAP